MPCYDELFRVVVERDHCRTPEAIDKLLAIHTL